MPLNQGLRREFERAAKIFALEEDPLPLLFQPFTPQQHQKPQQAPGSGASPLAGPGASQPVGPAGASPLAGLGASSLAGSTIL